MHSERLHALLTDLKRRPVFAPGPTTRTLNYEGEALERLLPHCPPFLLVDAVEAVDPTQNTILGRRLIRSDDPVLAGHLPGRPSYPAALQTEALAQIGQCLVELLRRSPDARLPTLAPSRARVLRVHHAAFLTPVKPGDRLQLQATLVERDGMTETVAGQIIRGGVIVSLAVQELYFEA